MFSLIAGPMAQRGASDEICDERAVSMRWTRGPSDQISRAWLKSDLSEIIATVDFTSYNG